MVCDPIERKLGISLGVTAAGPLLATLEITPQKPLQHGFGGEPARGVPVLYL